MAENAPPLSDEIENLIQAFDRVRTRLSHPTSDPNTGLAVPSAPASTVRRLKNSVDQFRLYLWAYVDTWALGGSDPRFRMRSIRIECAAELLGQLTSDLQTDGIPPTPEAKRLHERVRQVATLMSGHA